MATETTSKEDSYIEAVGRRKTATARVRLFPASRTTMLINDRSLSEYFATTELQTLAKECLNEAGVNFRITAKIKGGGIHAQAEALRHGIARALVKSDVNLKTKLKQKKFLTRDSRMTERKKFGLKKARKSAQWSKR